MEQLSEEAAVTPYYNNFFSTYRLGPEDVISVEVFNQERYSRKGIIVPPSGRVSLSLIPGGVFVNGKTVDEVAEIIKKRYDEYIIDPQVTVSLDKASSYRYSVIGDVGQPGVRLMNHRMTVTEAIAEAGGVLSTGDRSKVYVLRRQSTGMLAPIQVNVSAIYKGKAPDNVYLRAGRSDHRAGKQDEEGQGVAGLHVSAGLRAYLRRLVLSDRRAACRGRAGSATGAATEGRPYKYDHSACHQFFLYYSLLHGVRTERNLGAAACGNDGVASFRVLSRSKPRLGRRQQRHAVCKHSMAATPGSHAARPLTTSCATSSSPMKRTAGWFVK